MKPYEFLATLSWPHNVVGIWLFMELWRRIGKPPIDLSLYTMREGGYCLDAPNVIPAGACFSEQLDDETVTSSQITFFREEETGSR